MPDQKHIEIEEIQPEQHTPTVAHLYWAIAIAVLSLVFFTLAIQRMSDQADAAQAEARALVAQQVREIIIEDASEVTVTGKLGETLSSQGNDETRVEVIVRLIPRQPAERGEGGIEKHRNRRPDRCH